MYLVFGSCLRTLMAMVICMACGKSNQGDVRVRRRMGTAAVFVRICQSCGHELEWCSQPQESRLSLGNLKLAAGLFFSGCKPVKGLNMLRNIGVAMISYRTFTQYQRLYIIPAVYRLWDLQRTAIVEAARAAGGVLRLAGDARCDSPGK